MFSIIMHLFDTPVHTNGQGHWSKVAGPVYLTKIEVLPSNVNFGEMRVYFNLSWVVEVHGFIYTDPQFLKELSDLLVSKGVSGKIHYSEQGMQGYDYISFDINGEVIKTFVNVMISSLEENSTF